MVCWLLLCAGLPLFPVQAQDWKPQGEGSTQVWVSDNGPWRATVEKRYARLRFLGLRHGMNLLNSPKQPPDLLQIGGHRIWLGPQTEWAQLWPPPENWEMLPAQQIETDSTGRLRVFLAAGKGTDIALARSYRWAAPGVLECRVDWRETVPGGRQAIQIFQLNHPIHMLARARPSEDLPQGYLQMPLLDRPGLRRRFAQPPQVSGKGSSVVLTRRATEEKLAFPVQRLRAVWPGVELILHDGIFEGAAVGETDFGCRSQVYLGSDRWPVVEMEQLSPRLGPGKSSYTVKVTLRKVTGP